MEIGENIKKIRKTNGMTQEQLAERAGLSLTYISRVEYNNQNVSLASLVKIANALRVNISDIIDDHEYSDKDEYIEQLRTLLYSLDRDDARQFSKSFIKIIKISNK